MLHPESQADITKLLGVKDESHKTQTHFWPSRIKHINMKQKSYLFIHQPFTKHLPNIFCIKNDHFPRFTLSCREAVYEAFRTGNGTRDLMGPNGLTTEKFVERCFFFFSPSDWVILFKDTNLRLFFFPLGTMG